MVAARLSPNVALVPLNSTPTVPGVNEPSFAHAPATLTVAQLETSTAPVDSAMRLATVVLPEPESP